MIVHFSNIKIESSIDGREALSLLQKRIGNEDFNSVYFPLLNNEEYKDEYTLYVPNFKGLENQVVCADEKCTNEIKILVNPVNMDTKIKQIVSKEFVVNITTKDGKKHAVIHYDYEQVVVDEKRGDKKFESKEEADKYAKDVKEGKVEFPKRKK